MAEDSSKISDITMAPFSTGILTIAVVDFDLFTLLSKSPASVSELQRNLGISERVAEAMVIALQAMELLEEKGEHFFPTPLSREFLVKGNPLYMGGAFERNKGGLYGKLREAVITEKKRIYGDNDEPWSKHQVDEEKVRAFTSAMHGISVLPGKALAEIFDFSDYRTVLDIGGGSGAISIMAALQHSNLRAVLFDIPSACQIAEEFIAQSDLADRITSKGGDMFEDPLPGDADVVILSNILHDWNEDKCQRLLEKSYNYLPQDGAIIINEILLDENKSGPLFAALVSVSMLLWTEGGRQYTGGEISSMLKKSGFSHIEIKPTTGYYSIVIGRKV